MLAVFAPVHLLAKADEEAERAREAAEALTEIMNVPDDTIPDGLMSRAQGIAVIPGMKKAALGIGGTYGKGLVTRRMQDGRWSPPVFINIGGGSFGLQLGGQSTDVVLVFADRKGVEALLDGKLELGVEAAVAAGPVGRKAGAGTDIQFESPIYSYSRSKGVFAGVSLEGASVTIDDSANESIYGDNFKVDNILNGKVAMNNATRPFIDAVQRFTPAGKTSGKNVR
jgi:lipid-binding SYLF domain-containing protein